MKRCNKCQMIMGDSAKICFSCGASLEKNFTYICNNCGQVNFNNSDKCQRCGKQIISLKKSAFEMQQKSLDVVSEKLNNITKNMDSINYKDKAGEVYALLKGKANDISVAEYKEKAEQAYNMIKEKADEIPVNEYQNKAANMLDSAKDIIKDVPLEDYKEKAGQALSSIKEKVNSVSTNEYKEKIGTAYNAAKNGLSGKPSIANNYTKQEKQVECVSATTAVDTHRAEIHKNNILKETINEESNVSANSKAFSIKEELNKYKQFICGAAVVIALFGVYQLGANSEKTNKQVTQTIKEEKTKSANNETIDITKSTQTKATNKTKVTRFGYVNGDDVFVRSQPSTDSKPVTMLNKKTRVEVLESQMNNVNSSTYILKADGCIGYDLNSPQKFTLNKGLALKYESPGKYPNQVYCKIQTAVGEKTVAINNFSNVAEKITNNDWYNVRLSDGKTGWIYSKFVDISEVEK